MPVIPEFIQSRNEDGDRIVKDEQTINFRCSSCGIGCKSIVYPWSPQIAKFNCRHCNQTIEVKTRETAMDDIDGHIGEGGHQAKMAAQTSYIIGSPGRMSNDRRKLINSGIVNTKQMSRAHILDLE